MERRTLEGCTKSGLWEASNALQLPTTSLVVKTGLRFPPS